MYIHISIWIGRWIRCTHTHLPIYLSILSSAGVHTLISGDDWAVTLQCVTFTQGFGTNVQHKHGHQWVTKLSVWQSFRGDKANTTLRIIGNRRQIPGTFPSLPLKTFSNQSDQFSHQRVCSWPAAAAAAAPASKGFSALLLGCRCLPEITSQLPPCPHHGGWFQPGGGLVQEHSGSSPQVIFTHSGVRKAGSGGENCPLWCPEYPDQYFTSQTGRLKESRRAGPGLAPGQWRWKEALANWGFGIAFHHLAFEHLNLKAVVWIHSWTQIRLYLGPRAQINTM